MAHFAELDENNKVVRVVVVNNEDLLDENNQESEFEKLLQTQDQNLDTLDSNENTGDLEKKIIDKIK